MPAMPVIRQASREDAEAIAALCARAARGAYERIRREIPPATDWFGFVVAQAGTDVAGVAGTGRSADRPDACELFTLYVDPSCQRRGVGRALVARSEAQAGMAGATHLDVAVMPGNAPAIRFYEACGFSPAGERPIYAPHGKDGGPDVAMVYTKKIAGISEFQELQEPQHHRQPS